jgi:hypothetical protein
MAHWGLASSGFLMALKLLLVFLSANLGCLLATYKFIHSQLNIGRNTDGLKSDGIS